MTILRKILGIFALLMPRATLVAVPESEARRRAASRGINL
jgi:hypothetical protein